jgi:diguanylate cyclase (GGDEF)-like protein
VLAATAAVATQLVGEQRAAEEHRQSIAVLDETTALYSRGYFGRALPAEVRRAQRDGRPLHVILLDIDRFGDFNRRFGIEVGDALLRLIAAAITHGVNAIGDTLVTTNLAARFGGEEFVVMLAEDESTDGPPQPSDALRLAEELRKAVAQTTYEGAGVTVSVGVASMPADGSSADQLLDAADAALSVAVERGGDRVVAASSLAPQRLEDELAAEAEGESGTGEDDASGYDGLDASDFRSLDD